jgi:hypothetical protein
MSMRSSATRPRQHVALRSRELPADVQWAFVLWMVMLAAGVVEAILRITAGEEVGAGEIALRLTIYAIVAYVAARMRRGSHWARMLLAVVVGGLGTLCLVIEPVTWPAAGHSLGDALARANLVMIAIASARGIPIAAVLGAVVFMFRPAANAYFRTEDE